MDDAAVPGEMDLPAAESPEPRRVRRRVTRILRWMAAAIGLLASIAGMLYAFGTMQPPAPEVVAAYESTLAPGESAPPWRFHLPVPGCVCHSDDPRVQMSHATVYIRECSGCHGG